MVSLVLSEMMGFPVSDSTLVSVVYPREHLYMVCCDSSFHIGCPSCVEAMRILLVGDIHANPVALSAVLEDVGGVDAILAAGDLVDYNPWPLETLAMVRKHHVKSVIGNHDRDSALGVPRSYNPHAELSCLWTHRQLSEDMSKYLLALPEKLCAVYRGIRFFVCHGSPRDLVDEYVFPPPETRRELLREYLRVTETDVLVLGHTHVPFVEEFPEGHVVNPGSVGQPRDCDPRASYLIVDVEGQRPLISPRRVPYNVDEVARRIVEVGLPASLAQRLYRGF